LPLPSRIHSLIHRSNTDVQENLRAL